MALERALLPLLVLFMMTGCDNDPNPNFKNELDARAAAKAGDPYADLDNGDRRWGLRNYANQAPDKRVGYAQKTAVGIQTSYSSLLAKLATDGKVLKAKPLYEFCRPKFDAANALATSDASPSGDGTTRARQLYAALNECRDRSIDAEQRGDGEAAPVLKRFASVGMVMLGASTVAKGDRDGGEQLWNKASKLADNDTPGFQIQLDNFR